MFKHLNVIDWSTTNFISFDGVVREQYVVAFIGGMIGYFKESRFTYPLGCWNLVRTEMI